MQKDVSLRRSYFYDYVSTTPKYVRGSGGVDKRNLNVGFANWVEVVVASVGLLQLQKQIMTSPKYVSFWHTLTSCQNVAI